LLRRKKSFPVEGYHSGLRLALDIVNPPQVLVVEDKEVLFSMSEGEYLTRCIRDNGDLYCLPPLMVDQQADKCDRALLKGGPAAACNWTEFKLAAAAAPGRNHTVDLFVAQAPVTMAIDCPGSAMKMEVLTVPFQRNYSMNKPNCVATIHGRSAGNFTIVGGPLAEAADRVISIAVRRAEDLPGLNADALLVLGFTAAGGRKAHWYCWLTVLLMAAAVLAACYFCWRRWRTPGEESFWRRLF